MQVGFRLNEFLMFNKMPYLFISVGRVRNLVKTTHGYSFTYHVDCVLKNSINVSIGASLSISNPHASYM